MRKLKKSVLVVMLLAICGFSSFILGDIKVFQDKDGRITLTDDPSHGRGKKYRSGKISQYRYSAEVVAIHKVPTVYYNKIKILAQRYGLDEKLIISVAKAESGFNQFAISNKGAVGIMQLMSQTAMTYGVYNRYNADQNIEAGVRHLKYLYVKYNRNIPLTLAAYNAGEEAVKKYNGIPPYAETRAYVKRIMGYMGLPYTPTSVPNPSNRSNTVIYQYRTNDGKIVITDSLPPKNVAYIIID
jgi:hypothetical protein